MKQQPKILDDGLPTEPTDQKVNYTSLRWLYVAPPGFGKTEFFSTFENSIMFCCEEGHKFVKGHKIIIDTWEGKGHTTDDDGNMHMSFMEAKRRIEESSRFLFVIIDTLDTLIKKCVDHHLGNGKTGLQHLSDLGEFGRGYDIGQNTPIRKALEEIFATGRGLGLITHQHAETKSFSKGPKTKKETTLPNGILKIIFPQMDIIIHGEFGGIRDGNKHRDRIIKSEGSEDILAKNRGGILPPAWICPLDLAARGEQVKAFFQADEVKRAAAIKAASDEYNKEYEE